MINSDESVAEFLSSPHDTAFSFEILPPLRGNNIEDTFCGVKRLMEFAPEYINITTHRHDIIFREKSPGTFCQERVRKRPGTVAIAAVLRERFGVRPVPHLICGEYTKSELEDQLIDLSYLGVNDILILRGDRERNESSFNTVADGHTHAENLAHQVSDFNRGILYDGTQTNPVFPPITFGVAGYPEKHEEAMNLSCDLYNLKKKVESGASYIVTQMFFDNAKYFEFVKRCRETGINVPVIPGIKPLTSLRQLTLLPRIFHIDFPEELGEMLLKCRSDEEVRHLGIEWGIRQARELKEANVPSIHFYAMHTVSSICEIAKQVY